MIEHLYKDLISKMENSNEFYKTYQESNLANLFNNLIYKKEIQIYFNSVFTDVIKKYISSNNSSKVLFFEISELNNFIRNRDSTFRRVYTRSDVNQKKELEKMNEELTTSMNNLFKMRFNSFENMSIESINDFEEKYDFYQNSEQNEEFATKYLLDLNKNELKKMLQNKETKDNKNLKEYLSFQLNNMTNKNDNLYSNQIMLEKIQKSKDSEKILFFYERNFVIVIDIINEILEKLIESINNIPVIIKYILKMLYEILKYKFPHIKAIELYSCLSCVLNGIINNCFLNPENNLLLSDVLLGSKIKQNLNIIISIFSQLISFRFYSSEEKSDYSPFNLYFCDCINSIFTFYEKILDFNSTDLISHRKKSKIFNFHNNENPTNLNISNNDKQLFYSIAICYRVEDITNLLNIIQKNSDVILEEKTSLYPNDKFKIIFDKLKNNKEIFKSLKEKEKENNTINYYLLFEIKYSNILNDFIINKKYSPFFKQEIIENKNNSKKISRKNSLIVAQNSLSELLINIPSLESILFNENNINNLKQIMSDLSSYIKNKYNIMDYFNESSFYENDEKIPPEWYINYFCEMEEKMDEKYKKKEYEKFFQKFKKILEKEINEYKFDILSKLNESSDNIILINSEYNFLKNNLNEMKINEKIKDIIKNEIIEVEIKFKYNQNEKLFKIGIIQNNYNENDKNSNINSNLDNVKICYNISDFCKNFPDLNDIQKSLNVSIFQIMKELKISDNLDIYLNIISSTVLNKYKDENKQTMILIIQKYIFEKIYCKIFPKYNENKDLAISSKIISLSQITPEHLKLNNFDYDSMIPLFINLFNKLDDCKSPLDKFEIINQIFEIIFSIIKYLNGDEYSDEDLSNICEYFIIKVKPEKIYSNLMFIDNFENKNEQLDDNKINIRILLRSIENLLKRNYNSI